MKIYSKYKVDKSQFYGEFNEIKYAKIIILV